MATQTRIVCGYIRTPEGEAALETAVREAQLRAAHLTVVHFFMAPDEEQSKGGGLREHELIEPTGTPDTSRPDEPGFYEEELTWLDRLLTSRGIEHTVRQLPATKSVAEDLLQIAKDPAADLIVIGVRHRSRVGKLLLGSDAQTVLLEAKCPVLAVKGGQPR